MLATVRRSVQAPNPNANRKSNGSHKSPTSQYVNRDPIAKQTSNDIGQQLQRRQQEDFTNNNNNNNNNARLANFNTPNAFTYLKPLNRTGNSNSNSNNIAANNVNNLRNSQESNAASKIQAGRKSLEDPSSESKFVQHLGADFSASSLAALSLQRQASCPQLLPMMIDDDDDDDDEIDGNLQLIDGDELDSDRKSCAQLEPDQYQARHQYHSLVSHLNGGAQQANATHQSLDCVDSLALVSADAIIERYLCQQQQQQQQQQHHNQYYGHPRNQSGQAQSRVLPANRTAIVSSTSQYPQQQQQFAYDTYEHSDIVANNNNNNYHELELMIAANRQAHFDAAHNRRPASGNTIRAYINGNEEENGSGSGSSRSAKTENYIYTDNFKFQSRPEFSVSPTVARQNQLNQRRQHQIQLHSSKGSAVYALAAPGLVWPDKRPFGPASDLASSRHQLLLDQTSSNDSPANYHYHNLTNQTKRMKAAGSGSGSGRHVAGSGSELPLSLSASDLQASSSSKRKRLQANGTEAGADQSSANKLGCCGGFAKLLLFIANVLFVCAGIGLGGWGIWSLVEDHKYNLSQLLVFDHASRMSLFQLLSWSFITLGCASILIGFCGCSAIFKNNRWILGLYIFLILVIFALDLATGLLAIIFQERLITNVRLKLANKLRNEYGIQASFTAAIDYIQTKFHCCGLDGHFDYDQSMWRLQRLGGFEATVARTCCQLRNSLDDQAHINPRPINETMCQSNDVRFHQSYRYRKGCFDDLEALIRHKIWTFTIACGAVGAVILASLLFATCFCRSIPNQAKGDNDNGGQPTTTTTTTSRASKGSSKKQQHHASQVRHNKPDGLSPRTQHR